jgi:hypothetical protein
MWKLDLKDKCIHKYIYDLIERENENKRERENDCNRGSAGGAMGRWRDENDSNNKIHCICV